ncbi:MAG: LytTR family DNA-binding domain-containing protein [Gammaproteobacteria bacterium]
MLIVVVNATTIGIEYERSGVGSDWIEAWATESTSLAATGILLPILFKLLEFLDLEPRSLRGRVLWLIPLFAAFSLAHIGLFVLFRKLLWSAVGDTYTFDPILLGLVYEMRKDFMAFLVIVAAFYSYRFIINRLQGEAQFLDLAEGQQQEHYRSQFLVKMLDREYLVKTDDIDWIQSAGNYVLLNCGERRYPMRQTLKSLSEQLDPKRFQRVHRTAIVNLSRVSSLQDKGETEVELQNGEAVPVSKTYLPKLREVLIQSSF